MCKSSCIQDVCLHVSANHSFGLVEAENSLSDPVGIRSEFEQLVNVIPYPPALVRTVVPARHSRQIVKLSPTSPRPGRFPFTWICTYGDPLARHHPNARYHIPFGGK